jgi:hypothetical protein
VFKPTLLKGTVTLGLFIFFSWLWRVTLGARIMDASFYGTPFHFFSAWGPCPPGQTCSEFDGWGLVLDIFFWYVISAFALNRIAWLRSGHTNNEEG